MEVLSVCLTSIFSYVALFILTKMMGHKQVSQLDFFDYITGITIGSIAAEFATELEAPWKPLLAMVIYAAATLALGFAARKIPITRKVLNGTSTVIMNNGTIFREEMKKAKLDLHEFLMMCREQGYFDISSIQTAIFECNGKLTILPKSTRRPATPEDLNILPEQEVLFAEVIMDSRIIDNSLLQLGVNRDWLYKQMKAQGIKSEADVFLAVCDKNKNIHFYTK